MGPAMEKAGRAKGAGGGQRAAGLVGAGILLSRLAGLVRESVFAHYFGSSDAADAFKAAFRIPNLLQNLFGEGVLSASFIPVYAALLARGDEEEAQRTAGAVLALLALATALLVLLGVGLAPFFIDAIAPGFHGAKRELTIRLVQILFPGAGLLVMSAWCLGILNSHRRFFLSYAAPLAWNGAMIATLLGFGRHFGLYRLAEILAVGSVVGSGLQVAVQWPAVRKLVRGMKLSLDHRRQHVREALRNFVPVFISRGVVQISAYVDGLLASLLPTGAVAALAYAQMLYLLPISLFGMSVSAAELPAMSGELGASEEVAAALRRRLNAGLRQITFFVLPSVVALLVLGDVIVAAIYQTGAFRHRDVLYVWGTLAGATIGLLASALGRLYSSTYYALRDTRNPLKYASVRVALTTALGIVAAFWLPGWLGLQARWGVAGLTAAAGIAAWVEYTLLRRGLRTRVGVTRVPAKFMLEVGFAAVVAAAAARGLMAVIGPHRPKLEAVPVIAVYGAVYFALAAAMKLPELAALRRLLGINGR
jgi:putative peptidoglycan lipid II flippase